MEDPQSRTGVLNPPSSIFDPRSSISASDELLPDLCRQFTLATGWPLQFTPAHADNQGLSQRLQNEPECCWVTEIGDGEEETGFLHLSTPDGGVPRSSYAEATSLAGVLGQLLGKLATATRRLESRNNDVSTLVDLGLSVPAQDNLPWALTQLLKAAVELTGTRCAAFFLLDPTATRLKLRAVYQVTPEEVPVAARQLAASPQDMAALSGESPAVTATRDGVHWALPRSMRSATCVAVQSETMPLGTLWIYDRRQREFTERDNSVLASIAAHVAAVLERVALLRTSDTQERITRDLKAASESQPSQASDDLPDDSRYEIAARCASCYELGGDLCEAFTVTPDQIAIAIGDASGNSIPAAMIMSAVRGALRTHPADTPQVPRIMGKLNLALYRITRSHQFMSLCYGVFDAGTRQFTYSNAGHPTPLLMRDGHVTSLESHGLLLGVIREASYETSVLQLLPGDLLIFYSDGITEARNARQEMFRETGIVAAAQNCRPASAAHILNTVWKAVDRHMPNGEAGDDRTLIVLRVR